MEDLNCKTKTLEKNRDWSENTNLCRRSEKASCIGKASKIAQTIEKDKASLIVTPKEGQSMAQLRSQWKNTIDPEKDKIRATLYSGRNLMVVQAETRDDVNKIINKKEIMEAFNVEAKRKKNPLLIVYNIESGLKDEEIVRKIINTNLDQEEDAKDTMRDMKVKFRTGPKQQKNCHMLEVAVKTRDILGAEPLYSA